jgi:hypothetical protein
MHIIQLNYFLFFAILLSSTVQLKALDIWVAPDGSDLNPGTREKPKATLSMALREARERRRLHDSTIKDGAHIILHGGTYALDGAVLIRPEDSGTATSPTFIEAAKGEKPVLSGGIAIKGWQKAEGTISGLPQEAQGKVWMADAPKIGGRILEFRQFWINSRKAVRASTFNDGKLGRILSVNKEKEEIWIPAPSQSIKDPAQMEFVILQRWAIAILRVKSLEANGDKARLAFYQPESWIESEHPWPAPFIDKKNKNGNSAFFLAGAIEFLNQPGEWFEDVSTGKVYYWPREGEDLTKAAVIAPALQTLVQVEGTSDNPVSYVNFKGIGFEHASWMRPSNAGHVPLQAGMYILDAYKLHPPGTPDKASLENQAWTGRQPAGVTISGANHVDFERCAFEHMAAAGIDFIGGTNNDRVEGCIFRDIGGTGIQMGFFGGANFEAHLPYKPSDDKEVCQYEKIANNLISDCTNEDWGCVGICVGYAHDITLAHNEVCNINYTGISLGWGWTQTANCMRNNKIIANHIHHFAGQLHDVGGIYTLSAQPNSEISGNSLHDAAKATYAHDPSLYFYIYLDEGSSYIRVIDNWSEKDKFFSNHPGPGNEWKNNGPQVSEDIKNTAGLEPEFKDLLKLD